MGVPALTKPPHNGFNFLITTARLQEDADQGIWPCHHYVLPAGLSSGSPNSAQRQIENKGLTQKEELGTTNL
jgi:hypothetical protein